MCFCGGVGVGCRGVLVVVGVFCGGVRVSGGRSGVGSWRSGVGLGLYYVPTVIMCCDRAKGCDNWLLPPGRSQHKILLQSARSQSRSSLLGRHGDAGGAGLGDTFSAFSSASRFISRLALAYTSVARISWCPRKSRIITSGFWHSRRCIAFVCLNVCGLIEPGKSGRIPRARLTYFVTI